MIADASWGAAYFWACAFAAIAGALITVAARNPIRSAMGLLVAILGIAGHYLALHAQFLAAIQLIVYAGAVVILFVFVIMLIGADASPARDTRSLAPRVLAGVGTVYFALLVGRRLHGALGTHPFRTPHPELGNIGAVGRELYTRALVPFELVTALFIVAVVAAIAVASGPRKPAAASDDDDKGGAA